MVPFSLRSEKRHHQRSRQLLCLLQASFNVSYQTLLATAGYNIDYHTLLATAGYNIGYHNLLTTAGYNVGYICRWRGCWWCLSRYARKKGTTSAPTSSFACYSWVQRWLPYLACFSWVQRWRNPPAHPAVLPIEGEAKPLLIWGFTSPSIIKPATHLPPQGAPPKQSFPPPRNYLPRTHPLVLSLSDITLFGATLLKVAPIIIKSTSIFIIIGSSSLLAPCLSFLLAFPPPAQLPCR